MRKIESAVLSKFEPADKNVMWAMPSGSDLISIKLFNNGKWMGTDFTVDLSPYLTKEDAQKAYQPIGNYALKGDIPSLVGYATEEWVNSRGFLTSIPDNYVTDSGLTETLASYLLKTDAASTYLSKTDAQSTYLSKTGAANTYQPKGEYQPAGNYALKSELPSYTTVPELTADYTVPANATTREFIYEIPVGATVYNITGASGIKWTGGTAPAVQANKTYLIRVIHNLATWTEF